MKPNEFWNSTYREINIYAQSNTCRLLDDMKREIQVQEAVSDKLIQADAMSNKHPKIVPIRKTFNNLFPEEKEDHIMTPEEITRKMREMSKLDVRF